MGDIDLPGVITGGGRYEDLLSHSIGLNSDAAVYAVVGHPSPSERTVELLVTNTKSRRHLANLDEDLFDRLFADDSGVNPLIVAQEERITNLRDLGKKLLQDWGGQFDSVVEAASGSLTEFVRLSGTFRAFDDPLFKLTMVNTECPFFGICDQHTEIGMPLEDTRYY